MNLQTFHHAAIIVSEYERSKHFYTELLGFPILRENYRPESNSWKLDLRFGQGELEIFCFPNSPKRLTYPRTYIHKRRNRPAGTPNCIILKQFPYLIKQHDRYALWKFPCGKCSHRSQRHQEILIKHLSMGYVPQGLPKDIPAYNPIGH